MSQDIVLSAYYVIGNLVNTIQIDKLKKFDAFVKVVTIELIKLAVNLNDSRQIGYADESFHRFPATATLQCLSRFSTHEKARAVIFNTESYAALKKFIRQGDRAEQYFALKTVSQLCFNDDIATHVNTKDHDLRRSLKKLAHHGETEKIKDIAEVILWSLKTHYKKTEAVSSFKVEICSIKFLLNFVVKKQYTEKSII